MPTLLQTLSLPRLPEFPTQQQWNDWAQQTIQTYRHACSQQDAAQPHIEALRELIEYLHRTIEEQQELIMNQRAELNKLKGHTRADTLAATAPAPEGVTVRAGGSNPPAQGKK